VGGQHDEGPHAADLCRAKQGFGTAAAAAVS
jgi:hypothetical protein